jgi:hypothetical protein
MHASGYRFVKFSTSTTSCQPHETVFKGWHSTFKPNNGRKHVSHGELCKVLSILHQVPARTSNRTIIDVTSALWGKEHETITCQR